MFGPDGGPFTIVFDTAALAADQAVNGMTPTTGLGLAVPTVTFAIRGNEQQRLRFIVTTPPAGGAQFTLFYLPTGTNPANPLQTQVTYDSNPTILALNIQTALEDMFGFTDPHAAGAATYFPGKNVTVSGTTVNDTTDIIINFQGDLANANVGQITYSNLTGVDPGTNGNITILDGAGDTVQTVVVNPAGTNLMRLSFNGVDGQTIVNEIQTFTNGSAQSQTALFHFEFNGSATQQFNTDATTGATPLQIQTAINQLPTIGANGVTVTSPNGPNSHGGPYVIEFTGTV